MRKSHPGRGNGKRDLRQERASTDRMKWEKIQTPFRPARPYFPIIAMGYHYGVLSRELT